MPRPPLTRPLPLPVPNPRFFRCALHLGRAIRRVHCLWSSVQMRRNRLKRLALHRQLTPDEEAILARPEPIPVPFHGPLWLLGEIPFNMAVKQEMRRAAREEYAEDRRLEAAGLDVPIRGGKVNWAKYGLDKDQEAMFGLQPYDNSADDSLDWEKAAGDEDDWE